MIRTLALLLGLAIHGFHGFAQKRTIDSLGNLLNKTTDPVKRVEVLIQLASGYYDYHSEKAYNYASEAYDLATEIDFIDGQRRSLTYKGYYFYTIGDYQKAIEFYRQSAAIALPRDNEYGYNLVMTGNVYRALADYDSAKLYYHEAVNIFSKSQSQRHLAFAYKNLGKLFVLQWNNQEAAIYFNKALAIYEKHGFKRGIADTWFSLSEVSKNQSDFTAANQYVNNACAISEELGDEFLKIHCLINKSNMKYRMGEYSSSLKICFEALGILKSKDMPSLLAALYSQIGEVYRGLGQNDVAVRYFMESLKIAEKIGIKYETAKVYTHIASILRDQQKYREAHEYIDKSLRLRADIGDEQGMSHSYSVRGLIFYREGKYDEAITWIERSLAIRRAFGNKEGITASLFNLSTVYAARNQMQTALALQVEALAIEESMENMFNIGFSNNRLGSIYTKLRVFDKAYGHLITAQDIAEEINSNALHMNNERYWSDYYEARGDHSKALFHYKRFTAARDSVYTDIGAQKLAELQALYQVEQKDQEINLLNQEKTIHENEIKLQRARIDQQTIVIISVIVCLVLVSWLAVTTYRYNIRMKKANREITEQKEEIQSQSEELIEANATIANINKELEAKIDQRTQALSRAYKELDTFFYRASHDFRRPLTTFLGLAEVAKITIRDPGALELFDKVKETAVNLDKMLVKLQSISDVGSQEMVFKVVMLKEIFDNVCDGFREDLMRRNIKTSCEVKLQDLFVSYPAMVKTIIENLIENAIQFGGVENAYIRMKATGTSNYVTIDIQDNGEGIAAEYHDQVFEMYFRGSERSKGNGLGLYIVKKAVEKLEGSITLSSIVGRGSTFTVMLPNNA